MRSLKRFSFLSVTCMALFVTANAALAWSSPLLPPPGCTSGNPGCDPPVNISGTGQAKAGALVTGGFSASSISITGQTPVSGAVTSPQFCIGASCITSWAAITGAWATNGSSVYYNGGNVGVGTANPGAKLDIYGQFRVGDNATSNASYDSMLWFLGDTTSGFRAVIDGANTYWGLEREYFGWQTSALAVQRSTGNVGIGTVAPSRRLTIQNTTASTNNQLLYLKQQLNDYGYSFNIDDVTTGRMYIKGVNNGVETNLMTLDRLTGNVGILTTPSAWGWAWNVVQVENTAFGNVLGDTGVMVGNLYWDGSAYKYLASNYGSVSAFNDGGTYTWYTAPWGNPGDTAAISLKMQLGNDLMVYGNICTSSYGCMSDRAGKYGSRFATGWSNFVECPGGALAYGVYNVGGATFQILCQWI